MERLMIVTATDEDSKLALLRESLEWNGFRPEQLHVIPWEKDYVTTKVRRVIQWLEQTNCEYVMWIDGHDSLVLKQQEDIISMFSSDATNVAVERSCWPTPGLADCYPVEMVRNAPRFINAGGYGGDAVEVICTLRKVLLHATTGDDQLAWTKAFLHKAESITLDYERYLFCSEGDGDTASADPCVRHWNGRVPGREEFWEKWKAEHPR